MHQYCFSHSSIMELAEPEKEGGEYVHGVGEQ
jgi:hypothetical protein